MRFLHYSVAAGLALLLLLHFLDLAPNATGYETALQIALLGYSFGTALERT